MAQPYRAFSLLYVNNKKAVIKYSRLIYCLF